MARGSTAKIEVKGIIKEAFGSNFVCENDGKLYVWANDGGERVQICLSMTCPKTFINDIPRPSGDGYDFNTMDEEEVIPIENKIPDITKEELDNIQFLMRQLDL